MTAAVVRSSGVIPVVRHLGAVARVLVLQVRPGCVPDDVDLLVGAQLGRAGLATDLDTVRSPAGVLRLLAADRRALQDYDAVVAITATRRGGGHAGAALERAAAQLSTRLPTLLVHVRPARSAREQPPRAGGGAERLVLPDDVQAPSAARLIAGALLGLLDVAAAGGAPPAGLPSERRLQQIVRLARDAFEVDAAELNLVDDGVLTTLVTEGSRMRTGPSAGTLCAVALERPGTTVMPDTWLDPDGCRTAPAKRPDPIRFYAAVPIQNATGALIGTLCVYDSRPQDPDELDLDLLQDLALLGEGELVEAELQARKRVPSTA